MLFSDIITLQPRNPILASLARDIESSPLKATELTEQLVDRATVQAMQSGRDIQLVQRLRTPSSKLQVSIYKKVYKNLFPLTQVRQLQSRFKKMNLPQDEFEEMFRLSQVLVICIWFLHTNCYPSLQTYGDVRLFTVKPRLLLVFASDEAVKYTREILQSVSWNDVRYPTVKCQEHLVSL